MTLPDLGIPASFGQIQNQPNMKMNQKGKKIIFCSGKLLLLGNLEKDRAIKYKLLSLFKFQFLTKSVCQY